MSIINDALKKVQTNLNPQTRKEPAPSVKPEQEQPTVRPQIIPTVQPVTGQQRRPATTINPVTVPRPDIKLRPSANKPNSRYVSLFTTLSVLILCSIFFYFMSERQAHNKVAITLSQSEQITYHLNALKKEIEAISAKQKQQAAATVPTPAPGTLTLKGVMTMNDKQVALINDGIYEVGQEIDGKRIVSISINKVEVDQGGTITTLTVK